MTILIHESDGTTLECNECGNLLIGEEPRIVITCNDCIQEEKDTKEMFENFTIEQRLDEVIQWVTNDVWDELSIKSKHRIIKQLGYMGYPTEDLEEEDDEC
jgi:DNA-directed RNA polymerase subunit M/transcription elongation factor TFIIS